MSANAEQFDTNELLKSIQDELKKLNAQSITDATLWKQEDIATYLGLSIKYIQNHQIFTRKDFPRAVVIPVNQNSGPTKRWKAKEVVAWATRLRENIKQ